MAVAREPSQEALEAHRAHRTSITVTRRFLVVGSKRVAGKVKGEEVELAITPAQEQHLINSGHVIPVPDPPEAPAVKQADEAAADPGVESRPTHRNRQRPKTAH